MSWLLKLETGGNQDYVFASNKLRESVGASELIQRSTTDWLMDALAAHAGPAGERIASASAKGLHAALLDAHANPPLDDQSGEGVEVIAAASGLAFVAFSSERRAQKVARDLTGRALREAPGLDLAAGLAPLQPQSAAGVRESIRRATEDLERRRGTRRPPAARFARWPLFADCDTSSLPAARYVSRGAEPGAYSTVSLAKRAVAEDAWQRQQQLTGDRLFQSIGDFERTLERSQSGWIAVVHADGNSVAQRFLDLAADEHANRDGRTYRMRSRELSVAVDVAAMTALRSAAEVLPAGQDGRRALLPLILGGDDFTAIVPGRDALAFTRAWLHAFTDATRHGPIGQLGAAAGIAYVKPHFPFSNAYALSSALAESAKKVKRQVGTHACAIDFQVAYDGTWDLDAARERLADPERILHGRPYCLPVGIDGHAWADAHDLAHLDRGLAALAQRREGRRVVSRSQLTELRAALPGGSGARHVVARHPGIAALLDALHGRPHLFTGDPPLTRVLDLIELADVQEIR